MISPVLDLQAAPPMVDGVRALSPQTEENDNGTFGAALGESLFVADSAASNSASAGTQSLAQQDEKSVHRVAAHSGLALSAPDFAARSATKSGQPISSQDRAQAFSNIVSARLQRGLIASSGGPLSTNLTEALGEGSIPPTGSEAAAKVPQERTVVENKNSREDESDIVLKAETASLKGTTNSASIGNAAQSQAERVGATQTAAPGGNDVAPAGDTGKAAVNPAKSKVAVREEPHTAQFATSETAAAILPRENIATVTVVPAISEPTDKPATENSSIESVASPASLARRGVTPLVPAGKNGQQVGSSKSEIVFAWNSVEKTIPSIANDTTASAQSNREDAEAGKARHATAVGFSIDQEGALPAGMPLVGLSSASDRTTTALPVQLADADPKAPAASHSFTASADSMAASLSLSATSSSGLVDAGAASFKGHSESGIASSFHFPSSTSQPQNVQTADRSSSVHTASTVPQSELGRAVGTFADGVVDAMSKQGDVKLPQVLHDQHGGSQAVTLKAEASVSEVPSTVPRVKTIVVEHAGVRAGAASQENPHIIADRAAAASDGDTNSDPTVAASNHVEATAIPSAASYAITPAVIDAMANPVSPMAIVSMAAHGQNTAASISTLQPAAGSVAYSAAQAAGVDASRAATVAEPHQVIAATPTSLEVGVHGGADGWVKIRAEVGDQGGVKASLEANSVAGEQMLKGQLPALNDYLHSQQMTVVTSVAERASTGHPAIAHESGAALLQAGAGSAGQDASLFGNAGQSDRQQHDSLPTPAVIRSIRDDAVPAYDSRAETSSFIGGNDGGRWLNVRV